MDVFPLVVVDDVFAREQDLRDVDAIFKEHFVVNMHQLALSDRRGGLFHGKLARPSAKAQLGGAYAHCARGDEHHVEPAVLQITDRAHQPFDAADVELSVFVCQRRGTHLDYDAADLVDMQHKSHLMSVRGSARTE